jgi:predicted RNase H-like HicB family nuclease
MQHYTFTAQIERDIETGVYVGRVPALPGAHTQAKSLDELQANLREVIELCLEELTPNLVFFNNYSA